MLNWRYIYSNHQRGRSSRRPAVPCSVKLHVKCDFQAAAVCQLWGFHCGATENSACYVAPRRWMGGFWHFEGSLAQWSSWTHEDEGSLFLRFVGCHLPRDVTSQSINSCGCLKYSYIFCPSPMKVQALYNCSFTLHATSCLIPVSSVRMLHNLEVHFASPGCECTTLETLMPVGGLIWNGCLGEGADHKSAVVLVSGPQHVRNGTAVAQSVQWPRGFGPRNWGIVRFQSGARGVSLLQ